MDKDTFARLVTEMSPALYRTARALLRSEDDCRDALSEAVLRAWSSLDRLRDETRFPAWMTRIVVNESRAIVRRQRRIVLTDTPPEPPVQEIPPVMEALYALPDTLRLPVVLHYVQGYSVEETASILRLPRSTVRGRLARARKALRLELSEEAMTT